MKPLMNAIAQNLGFCVVILLAVSCTTSQSHYAMLGRSFPPKPKGSEAAVFRDATPVCPFIKISRLDVHLEKTYFIGSTLADALPELKRQARLSGADAIIEIQERHSMVGETRVYHVTATGIRYIETR